MNPDLDAVAAATNAIAATAAAAVSPPHRHVTLLVVTSVSVTLPWEAAAALRRTAALDRRLAAG